MNQAKTVRWLFMFFCVMPLVAFSQNNMSIAAEYFWDADPGAGNGIALNSMDGSFDESIEAIFLNTSSLPSEGNHKFSVRIKDVNNNWGPVFSTIIFIDEPTTEQREIKITSAEIFWDVDPGAGNGIPVIAFDSNFDEVIEPLMYDSSSLPSEGNHIFNIRVKDAENVWSPVFSTVIYIDESFTEQRQIKITAGEVFWDSDPGVGNAFPMLAIDGNFDEALEQATFSTGTLPSVGNHKLSMRVKDAENAWSPVFSTIIYVEEVYTAQREIKITAGEIFWDTDPGAGNGQPVIAMDGNFDEAIEQATYQSSSLPGIGVHKFGIRFRGAENSWSPIFSTVIEIDESVTALRNIKVTLGEMFWDTDPGLGNGIGMAVFDGNFDKAIEQVISCSAALPSVGAHKLGFRVRDAELQWSPAYSVVIVVDDDVTALRDVEVTAGEYFWDTDPGQGNAIPMFAVDGSFDEAIESIAATSSMGLSEGPHVLKMRTRDAEQNWGPMFGVVLLVDESTTELRNVHISKAEYWFDADPGQGNGTPMLSMDASFDEAIEGIIGGAIPSPVTSGIHTLYMRASDAVGGWGPSFGIVVNMDINVTTFTTVVSGPENLCSGIDQLNQAYFSIAAAGSTYSWSVVGGVIIGGQGTPDILVNWNSGLNHKVILNQCLGGPCQTDTLFVNIHDVVESTDYVTICEGESYFAGGALQQLPGIFVDQLQSVYGCDSIVTTVLTVLNHSITNLTADICQGQSIFLGGAWRTTPGTYLDTYNAANGCDSLVYTTLFVHPNYSHNIQVEICTGDSYFAGGAWQTTSGFYSDMFTSAFGCDSLVVTHLLVGNTIHTTEYAEICQGDSYFAGGANQTTSGNYVDVIPGACTEIRTTVLTVHPTYDLVDEVSIYNGQSYFAGGDWQNESGAYVDYYLTEFGCDSIVTTNLNVIFVPNTEQIIHICEGESFYAGGAEQTESGTYVDVVTGACTTTLTTYLTVHPSYQIEEQIQICEGQSYFAGGAEQTESGTYIDSFVTSAGCDSVITTILTVVNSIQTTQTIHICDGESYFAGGDYQTTSGIYVDEIFNGVCNETLTTVLVVHAIENTFNPVVICHGQSYFAGGEEQTTSGVYEDIYESIWGCDSIVTTMLTVTPPVMVYTAQSICEGDSVLLGGEYQTEAGEYIDMLQTTAGCDSMVFTTLSLYPSFVTNTTASICYGDSIFLGGDWRTTAGDYEDLLLSQHGCDSLVITTLSIVIDVPTPTVINNGDGTVSSSLVADGYEWIIDGLGCPIVTIETVANEIYLPEYCNGEAFVIRVAIIENGCQSEYSEPETVIIALCSQLNDHCSGAYELDPDGPILIDSNQCATNAGENEGSCSPDIGRSAWYKFDAEPNTSYTIKLENVVPISSQFNPKLEFFEGSCSALVQLDCVNVNGNGQGETITTTTLNANQDHYIRVSGFLVQAGSYRISIVKNNNCAGDFDGNGVINVSDLLLFSADYGCVSGCFADLDGNNLVNVIDLLIFNSIFGTPCQ